jgi:hypothetical protein
LREAQSSVRLLGPCSSIVRTAAQTVVLIPAPASLAGSSSSLASMKVIAARISGPVPPCRWQSRCAAPT